LSDYANHLENESGQKKWLLIYLCNNEPSEESISSDKRKALEQSGNLICFNFKKIEDWLDNCAIQTKALVVRIFIEEFARFVRANINGELDMSEEQEVVDVIRASSENIAAAFHVFKSMNTLKQKLLQAFHDDLERSVIKKGFQLVWDVNMSANWEKYVGFGVKFNVQDNKYLRIHFEKSGLSGAFWGIKRSDDQRITEICNEIKVTMQQKFGQGEQWDSGPWSSNLPNDLFVGDYSNWGISEQPWIEMANGTLVTNIIKLSKSVYDVFQASNKLHLLQ
jgi:hypothetical protein